MKYVYLVFRQWGSEREFCCAYEDEAEADQDALRRELEWVEKTKESNEYPWYVAEIELK
jgi:hypothetical protein